MATYYIDPDDGSDLNTGLSNDPGAAASGGPWKTMAKAAATVAQAGDRFLLKRGSVIRETGSVFAWTNGTVQLPITIGAYGRGPRPIWDGFKKIPYWSWTDDTTVVDQVYQKFTVTDDPVLVIVNGVPARKATSGATIQEGEWYWASNTLVYRRAKGTTARDYVIEITDVRTSNRDYAMFLSGVDNLIIQDLHFSHWVSAMSGSPKGASAIRLLTDAGRGGCTGVTIRKCKFSYFIDGTAIDAEGSDNFPHDIRVEENEFEECAQILLGTPTVLFQAATGGPLTSTIRFYKNSLKNVLFAGYGAGEGGFEADLVTWVSTQDMLNVYYGYNTVRMSAFPKLSTDDPTAARASVVMMIIDSIGDSGSGTASRVRNPIIEYNDIEGGNHQIILDTTAGGEVRYNRCTAGRADPFMLTCAGSKRGKGGKGLVIHHNVFFGGHDNGAQLHQCDDVTFSHNTVAKSDGNGLMVSHDFGQPTGTNKKLKIYNNIFFENGRYTQRPYQHEGRHAEIFLAFADSVEYSTFECDYNIFRHTTSAGSPASLKPFMIDSNLLTLAEWSNALQVASCVAYDAHSAEFDPKFITPGSPYSPGYENFELQSGSPAISFGQPTKSLWGADFLGRDQISCDAGAHWFISPEPAAGTLAGLISGSTITASIPPANQTLTVYQGDSFVKLISIGIDLSQITAASFVARIQKTNPANQIVKRLRVGEIEVYGNPKNGILKLLLGASDTGSNPGISPATSVTLSYDLAITVGGVEHTILTGNLNVVGTIT